MRAVWQVVRVMQVVRVIMFEQCRAGVMGSRQIRGRWWGIEAAMFMTAM
jgi:hypothetical protein